MEDAILKHDLYLDLSHFKDTISLGYAEIDGNIFSRKVRFQGNAIFPAIEVKGHVFFDKSRFMNIADFSYSTIYSFFGDSCIYEKNAVFNEMKIKSGMICDTTTFNGITNFSYAEIGGCLQLNKVYFKDSSYFNFIKIEYNFYLHNATFNKYSSFVYCDIKNSFEPIGSVFNDAAIFTRMSANDALFLGTRFRGEIELTGSNFKTFWPKLNLGKNIRMNIDGMKFESVMPLKTDDDMCNGMIEFLKLANYSADVYEVLEDIFNKRGIKRLADKVYISKRNREREEFLTGNPFAYALDRFWNILYRYGRKPERAFGWALLIFISGFFLFSEKRMIKRSGQEYESIKFSKFWFSFDLLIPFVQLPYTKIWIPRDDCFVTKFWYRFHKIGGWFTITIGTLAITGLIK